MTSFSTIVRPQVCIMRLLELARGQSIYFQLRWCRRAQSHRDHDRLLYRNRKRSSLLLWKLGWGRALLYPAIFITAARIGDRSRNLRHIAHPYAFPFIFCHKPLTERKQFRLNYMKKDKKKNKKIVSR